MDLAVSSAVDAAVFLRLERAAEGLRNQVAFEAGGCVGRGDARGGGEEVDEFEHEEARECAAEVAYTMNRV